MAVERTHIGWKFWFWWLLATTVGWMLGFVILASFPKTTTTRVNRMTQTPVRRQHHRVPSYRNRPTQM